MAEGPRQCETLDEHVEYVSAVRGQGQFRHNPRHRCGYEALKPQPLRATVVQKLTPDRRSAI